jgi:hypothetical protein
VTHGRGARHHTEGAVDKRMPPVNVVELVCLNEAAIGGRPLPSTRSRPTAELGVRLCSLVKLLVLTPNCSAHACSVACMQCPHAVRMQCVCSAYAMQMPRADAVRMPRADAV